MNYASRSILKYTKYPDVCKQFLLDSMDVKKMDKELSVSQWAPVLKSYLPFEVWNRNDYMKALIELANKGNPQGYPDVFNDAWREQNDAYHRIAPAAAPGSRQVGPRQGLCGEPSRC